MAEADEDQGQQMTFWGSGLQIFYIIIINVAEPDKSRVPNASPVFAGSVIHADYYYYYLYELSYDCILVMMLFLAAAPPSLFLLRPSCLLWTRDVTGGFLPLSSPTHSLSLPPHLTLLCESVECMYGGGGGDMPNHMNKPWSKCPGRLFVRSSSFMIAPTISPPTCSLLCSPAISSLSLSPIALQPLHLLPQGTRLTARPLAFFWLNSGAEKKPQNFAVKIQFVLTWARGGSRHHHYDSRGRFWTTVFQLPTSSPQPLLPDLPSREHQTRCEVMEMESEADWDFSKLIGPRERLRPGWGGAPDCRGETGRQAGGVKHRSYDDWGVGGGVPGADRGEKLAGRRSWK